MSDNARSIERRNIEAYLQWITNKTPPVAVDQARLDALDARIANAALLVDKVKLIAERHRIANPQFDPDDLVEGFVKYAGAFSQRNHITYPVWREMGVPAAVLDRAGLKGGGGPRQQADPDKPAKPRAPRREWSEALAIELMTAVRDRGPQVLTSEYGYAAGYRATMMSRLMAKYPLVAGKVGYDHKAAFPQGVPTEAA